MYNACSGEPFRILFYSFGGLIIPGCACRTPLITTWDYPLSTIRTDKLGIRFFSHVNKTEFPKIPSIKQKEGAEFPEFSRITILLQIARLRHGPQLWHVTLLTRLVLKHCTFDRNGHSLAGLTHYRTLINPFASPIHPHF